jgi:hypothetical protein
MVVKNAFLRAVLIAQFVAVGLVFYNHLAISFLKGWSHFVPAKVYSEPAVAGLVFLFVSSGYLTHRAFFSMVQNETDGLKAISVFLARKFWRLAIPVYFVAMADLAVFSFRDFGSRAGTEFTLPYVVTLIQTWYYFPMDSRSLALPFGGANMAWLGANLFFLAVVYSLTQRFWFALSMKRALVCFVCLAIAGILYFVALDVFEPQISMWGAERYGTKLAGAYSLWAWLFEYSPYGHVSSFFSGVVLAQIHARFSEDNGKNTSTMVVVISVAALLSSIFVQVSLKYIGFSLLLLTGLFLAFGKGSAPPAEGCTVAEVESDGLLDRLARSSYEIFVLHLVFALPFTLAFSPALDVFNVGMLVGRLIVATIFVYLMCLGLTELVLNPLRERVLKVLGLPPVEDRFV